LSPTPFKPLAIKNDAKAQYKYAERLEQRAKESKADASVAEAIFWYRRAAALGNSDAKDALKRLNVSESE
jgi:TPR repeat protein